MMQITDIKTQVKNPKRVSIYLDGNYYCGLDLLTVVKERLKVGQSIEKERLVQIQRDSEFQACFDSALTMLSKRFKTQREITDKLVKKGYLLEIAKESVEKLKDYGYIDDSDYSKRYLETYKKKKGKLLLKMELKRKGVDENTIEKTLEEVENELETAIKIAEKYVKNKEKDAKLFAKCYKYLLSKGFNYEDSMEATKKVIEIEEN